MKNLPHQSRLGNSSNFSEIPRQAMLSNGGPHPKLEVFTQADYKGEQALKSCHSEFHRILWCGLYRPAFAGFFILKNEIPE